MTITAERCRELFEYRDGHLWWRERHNNAIDLTKPAGCLNKAGYRVIRFEYVLHLEHRLVWLRQNGEFPSGGIDHIDGNGSNNNLSNLRDSNQSQNGGNSRKSKNNKSGVKGVSWDKSRGKWLAQIMKDRKHIYLGRFDCIAAASIAHQLAAEKYFGEFARSA